MKLQLHKAPHSHKAHKASNYVRKIVCDDDAVREILKKKLFNSKFNFSNIMWSFVELQLRMALYELLPNRAELFPEKKFGSEKVRYKVDAGTVLSTTSFT